MKRILSSTILGLCLLVIGYALGFLRLPLIEVGNSFWIGFGLSAGLSSLLYLLLSKKKGVKNSLIVLGTSAMLALLFHFYFSVKTSELKTAEFELVQEKAKAQAEQYETLKNSHLALVSSFIKEQLKADTLDVNAIKKLVDLSNLLKPQGIYVSQDDSLVKQKLSPGRGQLLKALLLIELDTSTLDKIYHKVSFKHADLRDSKLDGAYLKGILLEGANLSASSLKKTNLQKANLRKVQAINSNFSNAQLKKVNFEFANLNWSVFNNANMTNCLFDAALLKYVNVSNCKLFRSSFKWAKMQHVMIENSILEGVDFWAANLKQGQILNSNVKAARFIDTKLAHTSMKSSTLTHSAVPKDWFSHLKKYPLKEYTRISSQYLIERDSSKRFPVQRYFLKLKAQSTD